MQQFKIGDWVLEIHSEEIHQIIELFPDVCRIRKPISEITYSTEYTDLIPWQPQKGEWCWFYDNTSSAVPILAQFDYMSEHTYVTTEIEIPLREEERSAYGFNSCIPFIGKLPSFLKENNDLHNLP